MLSVLLIVVLVGFVVDMPVTFVLGISTLLAMLAGHASSAELLAIPQRMVASLDSFPLLAVPLFVLAGNVMVQGGVSKRIVVACNSVVGHLRGGLACVAILACTIFAAISGSTPATCAAIGSLMIPEMQKRGYPADFSSAVVASASCLGVVIPPSIISVVVGVNADISVGKMLVGGIIPGLIISAMLIVTNIIMSKKKGYPKEERASLKEIWVSFKDAILALLMPIILLGGIFLGIFTPTESAVVSLVYGIIISAFVYKELKLSMIGPIFYRSAVGSSMVMLLIASASAFGWFLTSKNVPNMVASAMLSISNNPMVIFAMVLLILLILGTFMDSAAIITLAIPILAPIMRQTGVDMVHFGVLSVIAIAIGMATPPVGVALFSACTISKTTVSEISTKVWPFLIAMVLGLILLMFIPSLTTFLPSIFIK